MMMRYGLAVLAYIVPTFAIAFVWHLHVFAETYAALQIYRNDIIVPFGFLSMIIQAMAFAWIYEQTLAHRPGAIVSRGLIYGALAGVLSWSFTTLAVAAKNHMASAPDYLMIETAFTAVQWVVVGPLTALAFSVGAPVHRGRASA